MKPIQKDLKHRQLRGFTLVELLVTISIMATVAGMFLVAYRGAATEASNIKTQSTIRKITEVLNTRLQEYENTPVSFVTPIPGNAIPALSTTDAGYEPATVLLERARLLALRELICLEMPDSPADIRWTAASFQTSGLPSPDPRFTGLAAAGSPVIVRAAQSSRALRIMQKLSLNGDVFQGPIPNWEVNNANSELLYLVVEDSTINGSSAMELFGRTEVADTDNDGFLEFIDAYRRPIRWVRWPSGFPSTLRYHPDLLDPALIDPVTKVSRFAGDSIDRMTVDPGLRTNATGNARMLIPDIGTFPLVASSGADGIFGQRFAFGYVDSFEHLNGYELKPSDIAGSVTGYEIGLVTTGAAHPVSGQPIKFYSARDVIFPTPYGNIPMPDPWYPRPRPPLYGDDLSLYRLGKVINPSAFKDDVTNFDINGAYQ
jgi:prepilin-type N-terminal cleavage/methylation domain-containing protein